MDNNYGEQMNLMGQIEALLKLEIETQTKRQKLEEQLAQLKEATK